VFRHTPKFLDHTARHQPKISRVQRQSNIRQRRHHAIKHVIANPQRQRFFSPYALGVDHVVSLLIFFNELRYHFLNVLQIPVHHNNGVARNVIQRRGNRRLVSEIPRERAHHNSLIFRGRFVQYFESAIRAAVVHEHDFMSSSSDRIQHEPQPQQQFGQDTFFVVDRDRDRQA
jgi:hypothetical protein